MQSNTQLYGLDAAPRPSFGRFVKGAAYALFMAAGVVAVALGCLAYAGVR